MASSVAKQTEIIKDTAKELLTLCENPNFSDLVWYELVGRHLQRLKEIHDGTFDLTNHVK